MIVFAIITFNIVHPGVFLYSLPQSTENTIGGGQDTIPLTNVAKAGDPTEGWTTLR